MKDEIQQEILRGFLLVMKPIARILLRFGIGHKEFNEITKQAFVSVASSDFGIRGRPTNISRVAVMTGLTRKEVRRIRDKIEAGVDLIAVRNTPLWRLLHNWYTDPRFLDADGKPLVLDFAEGPFSFSELVRITGGDIPPGAIRTELKRVGAVVEREDRKLEIVKRNYIPDAPQENLIESLVHCIYPVVSTISHNTDPGQDSSSRWPNKTAYSTRAIAKDVPRLRRISADRINSFAESMDDIIASYEARDSENDAGQSELTASVYIGAFYFEDFSGEKFKFGGGKGSSE
jgi:hypothetical protein